MIQLTLLHRCRGDDLEKAANFMCLAGNGFPRSSEAAPQFQRAHEPRARIPVGPLLPEGPEGSPWP